MRWTWGMVAAFLLVQGPAGEASAQQTPRPTFVPKLIRYTAELQVDLGPGTERCPDASYLRKQVADDLGYDPFVPGGKWRPAGTFDVKIRRIPGGLESTNTFVDAASVAQWTRPYSDRTTTRGACESVYKGVALQIIVALTHFDDVPEPQAAACPAPKAEPAASAPGPMCPPARTIDIWPPEWPMAPLPAPRPDPPKPLERWPLAVRIGASAWPELIVSGLGAFGFSGEVGARYRAFSFGVEAHGDPPLGSVTFPGFGTVSFGRASAAFLACGHYEWFVGCAVGDVGRFLFPDHVRGLPPSARYDAAGVRAGLEFPVAPPRIFLRTAVDVRAPIDPATYSAGHVTVFSPVGFSVGLGLGVLVELSP
jgi:hypothetical protein